MQPTMPQCFEGYEIIPRRWNEKLKTYVANVVPGEFYVTQNDEAITTILGSCVSCCIRDIYKGIGGLNHFMLPDSSSADGTGKVGDWAMEFLINGILLNGGERRNLEVKYFGGSQILPGLKGTAIGEKNINFVREYLARESIRVAASDVGGSPPRKLLYYPKTGRVRMKYLPLTSNNEILKKENEYAGTLVTHDSNAGDIELF